MLDGVEVTAADWGLGRASEVCICTIGTLGVGEKVGVDGSNRCSGDQTANQAPLKLFIITKEILIDSTTPQPPIIARFIMLSDMSSTF